MKPGRTEVVVVSAVKNPGDLWVQLRRYSQQLDDLMSRMQQYYGSLKDGDLKVNEPIIGQYCCALSHQGRWHRACIEEVHGASLHLRLIDFGTYAFF